MFEKTVGSISFASSGGSGTVTSVDLSVPSFLSVSGNPITTSGTLAVSLATQLANVVFAGPSSGGAATPTFRSLVAADIPSLSYADTTLSNLGSTAINADLIPASSGLVSLGQGSPLKEFNILNIRTIQFFSGGFLHTTIGSGTMPSGTASTIGFINNSNTPMGLWTLNQAGTTESIRIESGNSSANNSGDIRLLIGTAAGTQGDIRLLKSGVASVVGQVWTATDTAGAGYWTTSLAITELTGDVTATGPGSVAATIAANAVSNTKLADMATATFKGRTTAGTGDPEDLTATQATALLNVFTTSLKGLAPASGGGTTNFLRADGTWAAPSGGANTSLSNLGTTSINADLYPSGASRLIGYPDKVWFNGFFSYNSFFEDFSSSISLAQFGPSSGISGVIPSGTGSGTFFFMRGVGPGGTVSRGVALFSESDSTADATASGTLWLETGNKTDGTGDSGDIRCYTGSSVGGSRGVISLAARNILLTPDNKIIVPTTVTAGGTTGAQTINKVSGTVNFAATDTSLVVTNSVVDADSIVLAVVRTDDATAVIKNVVPSAGSFTINLTAAATAETSVGFFVIN